MNKACAWTSTSGANRDRAARVARACGFSEGEVGTRGAFFVLLFGQAKSSEKENHAS